MEQSNIAALERTLSGDRATRAVAALAGTHPFGILGIRASAALAQYMGYFASRILAGVRVLTDSHLVPFREDGDIVLVAPVGADLIFDTHGAALTLSTALLDAVARHDPRRSQARLELHEQLVERWALPD